MTQNNNKQSIDFKSNEQQKHIIRPTSQIYKDKISTNLSNINFKNI